MIPTLSQHQIFSMLLLATLLLNCTLGVWAQDSKTETCCEKKPSPSRIKTEITDCIDHPKTDGCYDAIIFTSQGNQYCTPRRARWVRQKMRELDQEGRPCRKANA
ncbi:hypothetical protein AALO_G00213090 [Alosa alosa]|uniref:Chemokine interleukin-8-like domain-containing protein n=1 Tax=Alosa alosa TaxID=278164 RepID=A0AAV6G064_9TELE|nr:hypothetical protein AALO_G00213090 [Alosa alosa]